MAIYPSGLNFNNRIIKVIAEEYMCTEVVLLVLDALFSLSAQLFELEPATEPETQYDKN